MTRPFVIALDGPAAAGKGTLARLMADAYGLAHLDTGILYRGVAYLMLQRGEDPSDETRAIEAARTFNLESLSGADLRTREVSAAASVVAANPGVRSALLAFQRDFANVPRPGMMGAVLDGRDIGTVVCPDADVKFFVVARDDVRAERRWRELIPTRPGLTLEEVRADLAERDARDIARGDAPLMKASDAELIDTSDLSIEAAFATARRLIDRVFRRCGD